MDKNGATPLYMASLKGSVEIVQVLVYAGADVNAKDNSGSTPLHAAAFDGNVELAKCLVSNGADLLAKVSGKTPSDLATQVGNADMFLYLSSAFLEDVNRKFGLPKKSGDGLPAIPTPSAVVKSDNGLPVHAKKPSMLIWLGYGLITLPAGIFFLLAMSDMILESHIVSVLAVLVFVMIALGITVVFLCFARDTRCPSCEQHWAVKYAEVGALYRIYADNMQRRLNDPSINPTVQLSYKCRHCGYEWIYEYDATNTSTALPPVDQVKPPNVPPSMSTANSITERDARCPESLPKNENTWTAHTSLILGIAALVPTLINLSCDFFGLDPFPWWIKGSFSRFNYSVWFILGLLPQIALVPGVFLGCKGLETRAARIAKSGLIVCGISYLVPILFNFYFYVKTMIFGL